MNMDPMEAEDRESSDQSSLGLANQTTPPENPESLLTKHFALLGTLLTSLLVTAHLWSVSHYNYTTAMGILRTAGTANALVASIVWILPLIPALVLAWAGWVLAGFYAGYSSVTAGESKWFDLLRYRAIERTLYTMAGAVVAGIFVTPWVLIVGSLVLTLLPLLSVWLLVNSSNKKEGDKPSSQPGRFKNEQAAKRVLQIVLIAYLSFLMLLYATNDVPWIPAERLELSNRTTLSGYTLQDGDRVIFMMHSDRTILNVDAESIKGRVYCRITGETFLLKSNPLMALLRDRPKYPACDKRSS